MRTPLYISYTWPGDDPSTTVYCQVMDNYLHHSKDYWIIEVKSLTPSYTEYGDPLSYWSMPWPVNIDKECVPACRRDCYPAKHAVVKEITQDEYIAAKVLVT